MFVRVNAERSVSEQTESNVGRSKHESHQLLAPRHTLPADRAYAESCRAAIRHIPVERWRGGFCRGMVASSSNQPRLHRMSFRVWAFEILYMSKNKAKLTRYGNSSCKHCSIELICLD